MTGRVGKQDGFSQVQLTLDWPEQTYTSPKTTSLSVITSPPGELMAEIAYFMDDGGICGSVAVKIRVVLIGPGDKTAMTQPDVALPTHTLTEDDVMSANPHTRARCGDACSTM